MRAAERVAMLGFALCAGLTGYSYAADDEFPEEAQRIDRLAVDALAKVPAFRMTERLCSADETESLCRPWWDYEVSRIGSPYGEKTHVVQHSPPASCRAEVYGEGDTLYGNACAYGYGDTRWRRTRIEPGSEFEQSFKIGKVGLLEETLSRCGPAPSSVTLNEDIDNGLHRYVVQAVYKEKMDVRGEGSAVSKQTSTMFYDKTTALPLASMIETETTWHVGKGSHRARFWYERTYHGFEEPFEINMPAEAEDAQELSMEQLRRDRMNGTNRAPEAQTAPARISGP